MVPYLLLNYEKARVTAIKGYKLLKNCPKFVMDPNNQLNERRKRRNDFYEAKSRFLYILGFYHHCKVRLRRLK